MKTEYKPLEIRQQRSAWFNERLKPGMTTEEVFRLNEEALHLSPRSEEEHRQKMQDLTPHWQIEDELKVESAVQLSDCESNLLRF